MENISESETFTEERPVHLQMKNNINIWKKNTIPTGYIAEGASLQWYNTDTYDNYVKNGNKQYSQTDISYNLNSFGYRTKEFSQIDHSAFKILVSGCSFTFGVGLPLEEVWVEKLATKIRQKYDIPVEVINLAKGGESGDYIVRTISQTLNILKPNFVFGYFPHFARREYITLDENEPEIRGYSFGPWNGVLNGMGSYMTLLSNDEWDFFYNIKNVTFLESVLKDYFWSWGTWTVHLNQNNSFIDLNELEQYIDISHYRWELPSLGTDDKARDGMHYGKIYNERIANCIISDTNLLMAIAEYKFAKT